MKILNTPLEFQSIFQPKEPKATAHYTMFVKNKLISSVQQSHVSL